MGYCLSGLVATAILFVLLHEGGLEAADATSVPWRSCVSRMGINLRVERCRGGGAEAATEGSAKPDKMGSGPSQGAAQKSQGGKDELEFFVVKGAKADDWGAVRSSREGWENDGIKGRILPFKQGECKVAKKVTVASGDGVLSGGIRDCMGLEGEVLAPGNTNGTWKVKFKAIGKTVDLSEVQLGSFNRTKADDLCSAAAVVMRSHGNITLAEHLLLEALKLNSTHVDAICNYGIVMHTKQHNVSRAEALLLTALSLSPNDADVLCAYAGVLMDDCRKCYDGAEEYFRRALRANPHHVPSLSLYGLLTQEVKKDYKQAEKLFSAALYLNPSSVDALSHYGTFLGKCCEDIQAAEKIYRRVLELDPYHTNTMTNYGLVLQTMNGDNEAAIALFDRAIEIEPLHSPSLGFKALILHSQYENFTEAEKMYRASLAISPCDPSVLSNYAYLLHTVRRDYPGAEALYQRALVADPTHVSTLCYYGHMMDEIKRDYEAADKLFRRAIASDPTHVAAMCELAKLLATRCAKFSEAKAILDKAKRLEPESSQVIEAAATVKTTEKNSQVKISPALAEIRRELEKRRLAKLRGSEAAAARSEDVDVKEQDGKDDKKEGDDKKKEGVDKKKNKGVIAQTKGGRGGNVTRVMADELNKGQEEQTGKVNQPQGGEGGKGGRGRSPGGGGGAGGEKGRGASAQRGKGDRGKSRSKSR